MKCGKRHFTAGGALLAAFALWTVLVLTVDVRAAGETGTAIGFAVLNMRFHAFTGVHMRLYDITDWLGLVPLGVCLMFGAIGFAQMIRRKSLRKVDPDILLLGVYYALVLLAYFVFELLPINYRPILIEGRAEASYPSSTTLLVLRVMPTLAFQVRRRLTKAALKRWLGAFATGFSLLTVMGRLVSGVHWITDIVGAALLSAGLYHMYIAAVWLLGKEK